MKIKKYFNNNEFKYYFFIFIIQIILYNETCENDSCTDKQLIGTETCVGHCPSDYCELGDFCYPINNLDNYYMEIPEDTPIKTCKCKSNRYNKITENKVKYECLEEGSYCNSSSNYHNLDTGECVEKCDDKAYKIKNINGELLENRCSKCLINEYLYKEENECYTDGCPEGTYKYDKIGSKECVTKCDIYDEQHESCLDNCENKIIYDKLTENSAEYTKICVVNLDSGKTYYEYNGINFLDCEHTKDEKLFNITTYKISIGGKNKCIENCKQENYFLVGNECQNNCGELQFQYDNKCLENCQSENLYQMDFSIIDNNKDTINDAIEVDDENKIENLIKIEKSQFPETSNCLKSCPSGTYKDENEKKCYISSCSNEKYIKLDNGVLKCDVCEIDNKIYSEISYLKIVEENNETNYYQITRKYCLSSCPVSAPYSIGKDCSNITCKSQTTYKYSAYDKPYNCYESCSSTDGEYNYEKDYICYKQQNDIKCDHYYYIDDDNIAQCTDINYCITKFDYIKGKQCVNEAECEGYYKVKNGTKISTGEIIEIGRCYSDPKDCKNLGLYINEDKICLDTCNDYKIEGDISVNDINCFKNCPSNYPFKNTIDKRCKMYCPEYYYKDECLENDCKTNGKFNLVGSYECLLSCVIDNKAYYIKNDDVTENNDNICYYSCPDGYPFLEKELSENPEEPYKCLKGCNEPNTYYYEDKKICLTDCNFYNSNEPSDNLCVNQCPRGKRIVENNDSTSNKKYYCDSSCPIDKPYTLNKTLSIADKGDFMVEQCVADCEGLLISNNSKYCLKECTFEEKYKYNGYCYENCPPDTLPDDINNTCYNTSEMKSKCNPNFKYIEKDDNGYYKCKKSCSENKYYLLEGPDCYDECPSGYNYSTSSKLCLTNCDKTYGEYFQKEGEYNYTCLRACDKGKYVLNDTKECKEQCPDGYFETEGNLCIKNCSLDPNNPFLKSDNKTCGKNCSEEEFYRDYEKICIKNCDDDEKKEIINSDRKCVSKCENNYYNYEEDGECVNQCKKYSYLIEKKKLCVENCIYPYNFIKGNLCVEKCNEGDYLEKIENNLTKCVDSCSNYYYETTNPYIKYNCYDKCNDKDFYIIDTNKCIESCPVPYYSYYTDKKEDSVYQNNTCVLVCPSDKPFIYNSKCVEQCVSPYNYYIEGCLRISMSL